MRKSKKPGTHEVMARPSVNTHKKLVMIAEKENRKIGPQAVVFIEEGINRYLADNPSVE